MLTVLWEYFTGVLPDASPGDSRPAIILLRWGARGEIREILFSREHLYVGRQMAFEQLHLNMFVLGL